MGMARAWLWTGLGFGLALGAACGGDDAASSAIGDGGAGAREGGTIDASVSRDATAPRDASIEEASANGTIPDDAFDGSAEASRDVSVDVFDAGTRNGTDAKDDALTTFDAPDGAPCAEPGA